MLASRNQHAKNNLQSPLKESIVQLVCVINNRAISLQIMSICVAVVAVLEVSVVVFGLVDVDVSVDVVSVVVVSDIEVSAL